MLIVARFHRFSSLNFSSSSSSIHQRFTLCCNDSRGCSSQCNRDERSIFDELHRFVHLVAFDKRFDLFAGTQHGSIKTALDDARGNWLVTSR